MRRTIGGMVTLILVLSLVFLTGVPSSAQAVKNPDTFVLATIGDPETLDYAWAYDTASFEVIFNVYDTLIFYDGSRTDRFVPGLATQVPSVANGLISKDGRTYTFPIRQGVKFHDGTPLTPDDVAYSIRRFLWIDRAGGPSSLLLEPILGVASTRDEKGNIKVTYSDLTRAVRVQGNNVVITLKEPFGPFLSIMAQWSYVVSRKWAATNGDWDGTRETMRKFNNPKKEDTAFFAKANGTGPFKLVRWDRAAREVVLERNDNYWRGPAKLKRVIIRTVEEAATRILMIKAGDADQIALSRRELPQVQGVEGVRIIDDLPQYLISPAVFFTFEIDPTSPHIGSGKLDGNGIPPDFFKDVHVRRAFAYSFDYGAFLRDAYRGKGVVPKGPIPPGMLGYNPKQEYYTYSKEKAIAEFREAWGGRVWTTGFKLTILYNAGNVPREIGARMLKENIEALNPKFKVDIRALPWPTYLAEMDAHKLPVFFIGWLADYPDPHNFAFHFLHSKGTFPFVQKYANPEMDKLVEQAKSEPDPKKREALYFRLVDMAYKEVPQLYLVSPVVFQVLRSWVRGYYYNPVHPGTYFYPISKG